MHGIKKLDKAAIVKMLKEIDIAIEVNYESGELDGLEIGIVGGAAFILRGMTNRDFTYDIDSFLIDRKDDGSSIHLIEYLINNLNKRIGKEVFGGEFNSRAHMFSGILEYEDSWIEMFSGEFLNFRVFIPSIEMAVALKVSAMGARQSDNDYSDVFNKKTISALDLDKLREILDIWGTYDTSDSFKNGRRNFEEYLKEFLCR